jgi:glycogen operon protein
MAQADWDDESRSVLCAELRMASGTPAYAEREEALFLVFNAGDKRVRATMPGPFDGLRWRERITTHDGWFGDRPAAGHVDVAATSVTVCVLEPHDD